MNILNLFKKKDPYYEHCKRILNASYIAAKETERHYNKEGLILGHEKFWLTYFEFQNLYLQITDRILFQAVSEDARQMIMALLVEKVISASITSVFKESSGVLIAKMYDECYSNYKKSCLGYGRCKNIFPDDRENLKDTLVWEFCKTVCLNIGKDKEPVYMMLVSSLVKINDMGFDDFRDSFK